MHIGHWPNLLPAFRCYVLAGESITDQSQATRRQCQQTMTHVADKTGLAFPLPIQQPIFPPPTSKNKSTQFVIETIIDYIRENWVSRGTDGKSSPDTEVNNSQKQAWSSFPMVIWWHLGTSRKTSLQRIFAWTARTDGWKQKFRHHKTVLPQCTSQSLDNLEVPREEAHRWMWFQKGCTSERGRWWHPLGDGLPRTQVAVFFFPALWQIFWFSVVLPAGIPVKFSFRRPAAHCLLLVIQDKSILHKINQVLVFSKAKIEPEQHVIHVKSTCKQGIYSSLIQFSLFQHQRDPLFSSRQLCLTILLMPFPLVWCGKHCTAHTGIPWAMFALLVQAKQSLGIIKVVTFITIKMLALLM